MARKKENNATVIPFLGAGALGTAAYGSHKLDQAMNSLGILSKYELNPEAIQAFKDYAELVPNPKDPSSFAYQYAQAAHRAGNVQLFLNDPRKRKAWEWEMNNPKLRRELSAKLKGLNKKLNKFQHTLHHELSVSKDIPGRTLRKQILLKLQKLRRSLIGAQNTFAPLDEFLPFLARANNKPLSTATFMAAHVPSMAESPLHSYIRLLHEVGSGKQPMVNAPDFADNTVEALFNYKKPSSRYKPYKGMVFASPGDYLNEMYTPKGHPRVSGAFDAYLDSVKELEPVKRALKRKTPLSKKLRDELMWDIRKALTPSFTSVNPDHFPGSLMQELGRVAGMPAHWDVIRNSEKGPALGLKITKPGRMAPGISSVQDLYDLAHNHLGLKALNAVTTARYSQAAGPYRMMTNILRHAQNLRNGKLRAGLIAGSAALGGLGATNIYRNYSARKENGKLINRIKNWLEDRIDRI